jgi:hypothetical protein
VKNFCFIFFRPKPSKQNSQNINLCPVLPGRLSVQSGCKITQLIFDLQAQHQKKMRKYGTKGLVHYKSTD